MLFLNEHRKIIFLNFIDIALLSHVPPPPRAKLSSDLNLIQHSTHVIDTLSKTYRCIRLSLTFLKYCSVSKFSVTCVVLPQSALFESNCYSEFLLDRDIKWIGPRHWNSSLPAQFLGTITTRHWLLYYLIYDKIMLNTFHIRCTRLAS